jgi:hypothetical protein
MHAFKDRTGRDWTLDLTMGRAAQVRAATGVNLLDVTQADRRCLVQIAEDPYLGMDVIWVLVEPQAQARGVSKTEWLDAFACNEVSEAFDALGNEIVFFCHDRHPQKKVLQAAFEASRRVIDRAAKEQEAAMPQMVAAMEEAILTHGDWPQSGPPSSESTTATGASVTSPTESSPSSVIDGSTPPLSSPSKPSSTETPRNDPPDSPSTISTPTEPIA